MAEAVVLSEKRRGEIALALLKYETREKGISFRTGSQAKRHLGNIAKATGIPAEELLEFLMGLAQELMDETYAYFTKGDKS